MNRTLHFKFPLYDNNDKPSILNDYNSTITEIDRVLYALSIATGNSEEYERELERLQEDLIELTTIVNEHGKDLTEISQTIATILGSIQFINGKIEGYDDNFTDLFERVSELEEEIQPYTLPIASSEVLGCVKVGTGLSINENGVLSNDNPTPATPYVLPVASSQVLGGVKVGTGLSIDENGVLSSQGGQQLSDTQIGCKSLIYQIRKGIEVDGLREDYNMHALYSKTGMAHFGTVPEYASEDRRGAFALDVTLTSLNVNPNSINAVFSIEPNNDLGAYISYQLRAMKRNATLIDGTFHTDASDNTPTMISGLGMYEEDWENPGTYVFRPYCSFRLGWYDLVQSGDLTNDQFQLLQNAVYQYNKPYQQALFRFGFGNTNNPNSPRVILCIVADVYINMGGINVNLGIKYSSDDLTNSPSVFPDGYTKPSDYVKTPVFNDVGSTERQTTVALGALDGATATLNAFQNITMIGTPSSFTASNVILDQAWFNLILAEGNAISD